MRTALTVPRRDQRIGRGSPRGTKVRIPSPSSRESGEIGGSGRSVALQYLQLHAIVRTQLGGPPTVAGFKVLILRLQPRAETVRPEGVRRRHGIVYENCPSGRASDHSRVQLAFGALVGASAQAVSPDAPERRYALHEVKARLHQASFRDAVLAAYGGRCAISRLPEPRLLDAAHIVMDADEQLGQPIVSNGLPLTKIHHAAFDAHLIGVDPDYRIHVSDRLLEIHDGPFLELGLKGIVGQVIQLPRRSEDRPDRDRLALRFGQFRKEA